MVVCVGCMSVCGQSSINISEKNEKVVSNNNKHKFILNEENAIDQVAETDYYKELTKKYPNVIIFVQDKDSHYFDIYLGFDEGTHTTRKAFVRVSPKGTVQYSEMPPAIESDWVNMK